MHAVCTKPHLPFHTIYLPQKNTLQQVTQKALLHIQSHTKPSHAQRWAATYSGLLVPQRGIRKPPPPCITHTGIGLPDAEYKSNPVLHTPSHQRSITLHTLSYHLSNNTPKQGLEKALYKKCKNHLCRDALPPKKIPKTNETSDNAHRKACTDYPHITSAMHFTAYLPSLHLSNRTHHKPSHTPILSMTAWGSL